MNEISERRIQTRTPGIMRGVIHAGKYEPERDCSILDRSDSGAKLAVSDPTTIPKSFTLRIPLLGIAQECRVVWRKSGEVGVAFEQADADFAKQLGDIDAKLNEILTLLRTPVALEKTG